jgi:hypothetical protein
MENVKYTVNSNDKIKAYLGDLNESIVIPASAFLAYVQELTGLQQVTDAGNTTTKDVVLLNSLGNISAIFKASDGTINVNASVFTSISTAAAPANSIGVDSITGKLFYKNISSQVIYLDENTGTLTFEAATGDLVLSDELGNETLTNLDGRYILESLIGVPNGIVPLNSSGIIPTTYLGAVPINDTFVVADQSARLALAASKGDVAVQTDTQESYILQAVPASNNANWVKLLFPASVASVNGQTGVVSLTTTNISEGTNKYANATSVNPLIQNFLGRGIFLYTSANTYVKYNTIQDAITAYNTNDLIILANINITVSTSIVINKDVQINSINSFIVNNSTNPIFTDGGAGTSLYLRGQLYLRNNAVATAFSFTSLNGVLFLDGDFDFRDTKTTFLCNKYYYIAGVQTQTTDVLNFASGADGNLISKGVGTINYTGTGRTHNLTGVANTINANGVNLTVFQSKEVFNVLTTKSTLGNITLTNANVVLYNQLVNFTTGSAVVNNSGASTLKAYNSVFVTETDEIIVNTSGSLDCQLSNCGFISSYITIMTTTLSFTALMGYSYGNQGVGGLGFSGSYLTDFGFTSPVL